METQAQITPGMAGSGAVPQPSAPSVLQANAPKQKCKCGGCADCIQRAKWRAKHHAQKAKRLGQPYVAPPLPALSTAPGVAHSDGAQAGSLPPVPYLAEPFKPVVNLLVSLGEKYSVRKIVSKAQAVAPEIAGEVARDAPWNLESREALLTTGPHVAAKYAAMLGIPAESATDFAFIGALASVVAGHFALMGKLDDLEAKREAERNERAEAKP